ncbi:MAG: DUF1127 domain-containing protein [Pseudomonadota bacterium]
MLTLIERWRQGRARRKAIRELRGYDDALLRDLGITREEIVAYVEGRLPQARPNAQPSARPSAAVGAQGSAEVVPFPRKPRAKAPACPPACCVDAA